MLWDPIGLAYDDGAPNPACADEYDSYLLHLVSLISGGGSKEEAKAYLVDIASGHMGLSEVDQGAAAAAAGAIADYLSSLTNGPKTVG